MRLSATFPLLFLLLRQAVAKSDGTGAPQFLSYAKGDPVAVECLDRAIDTGEHVLDKTGKLKYVPFAQCNETKSSLQLRFLEGEDDNGYHGLNCTIPIVSDEMYHLLEFYIHHDSPLSCRVPARPRGGERALVNGEGDTGSGGVEWVPLIFAIAGKLESSHLHISTNLNLLIHLSPESPGVIDSAAAYSTSAATTSTRIIIGDPLPLHFRLRWYESTVLSPGGLKGKVGHGAGHTLLYCVLSAVVGAVGCYAWVVGVDVPRRLRRVTVGMKARDNGANGGIIAASSDKIRGGYGGYGFPGNGNGNGAGGGGGYGYVPGAKRKD
ncbi:hypothetical protein K440DRAFT_593659 [Wilcoxina mikolae CBS 423.85]|nr:hypothetical protein K440DRAFT_593659 [Wilcoxina mikolae CBS 423.85]